MLVADEMRRLVADTGVRWGVGEGAEGENLSPIADKLCNKVVSYNYIA
jgi:hypothetical protein